MKTKKIRILAILVCIALIAVSFSAFAGCNGESGQNGQTITFTPNTMPAGIVGQVFEVSVGNAGGVAAANINFRHTGNLPNGLVLDSNTGVISGTPLRVGTFNFSAEAFGIGAAADVASAAHSFSITIGSGNLEFSNHSLSWAFGIESIFDLNTLVTGADNINLNFSTTSDLPNGIDLSAGGVLSGTPASLSPVDDCALCQANNEICEDCAYDLSNFLIVITVSPMGEVDLTPDTATITLTLGAVTPVFVEPAMETFSIHSPHAFALPRLALPVTYPLDPVPGSLELHLADMEYEDEVFYAFYDEASAKLMDLLGFELRQDGVIHTEEVLGDNFNANLPGGQTQEIQRLIEENPQFEGMVTFIPWNPIMTMAFMSVTIKVYAYSSLQEAGDNAFQATEPAEVELTIWRPVNQTGGWVTYENSDVPREIRIGTPFLRRLARGSVAPSLMWAFQPAGDSRTVSFHALEASDPNHIAGTGELSEEFTLFANGLLHVNNALPANYPVGLRSFTVEARPGGTGLESRFFRAEIDIGYALLLFPVNDLSDPYTYWAERTVELTLGGSAGFPVYGARTPTGSNAPITYTATVDALPMGLSINAQNRLVGTPLRAYGRFGITVTASAPGYADRTSQVFIFINETYVDTDGVFEMLYMHDVDRRAGGSSSGSASGINMFSDYSVVQNSPHIGASASAIGWHYDNQPPGTPGINPPFEVVFNSDRATTTAHLVLRMAGEFEPFHLSNDSFHVELNGTRINTPNTTIIHGDDPRDITFTTTANILMGENVLRIRVLPNDFGPYGTGAPIMSHARFSNRSGAVLTWRPDTHNLRRFNIARWDTLSRTGATATPENVFRNPWNT